jgi:hypothetical protein
LYGNVYWFLVWFLVGSFFGCGFVSLGRLGHRPLLRSSIPHGLSYLFFLAIWPQYPIFLCTQIPQEPKTSLAPIWVAVVIQVIVVEFTYQAPRGVGVAQESKLWNDVSGVVK